MGDKIHPSVFADYRVAKRGAAALAAACGITLLQNAKGKPRTVYNDRVKDWPTWLAAYSWLHQIRKDQLHAEAARKQRETMNALPWANVIE